MDQSKLKFSIIFPCFNGEKFLKRNLDSVKNLSNLNEIELIVVDNNSTDSSLKIIKSYKNDIDIKIYRLNKNYGFAKACNIGVSKSKGEFIFITNQDVIFPPSFFQKLLKIYKKYKKNEEIIISPALVFESDGIHYFGAKTHFLGFSYTPEVSQKLPTKRIIKLTPRFSGCTLFVKKKLFLDAGGFDNHFFMYYEDTDLSLRFLRRNLKIYTTNDPFLIHQQHVLTLTNFRYYLLERNRFIVLFKNISKINKLIPFFLISEFFLSIQSILIGRFSLKVRIYCELLFHLKFFLKLRKKSKKEMKLLPYQKLSKTLDPILIADVKNLLFFKHFLRLFNSLLKLV